MKSRNKLWIGLLLLALLTPLGIVIPEYFKAGDAWGEWSVETLRAKLGGPAPAKLEENADRYRAPVPDYSIGGNNGNRTVRIVSYAGSALGFALVAYIIAKLAGKHE